MFVFLIAVTKYLARNNWRRKLSFPHSSRHPCPPWSGRRGSRRLGNSSHCVRKQNGKKWTWDRQPQVQPPMTHILLWCSTPASFQNSTTMQEPLHENTRASARCFYSNHIMTPMAPIGLQPSHKAKFSIPFFKVPTFCKSPQTLQKSKVSSKTQGCLLTVSLYKVKTQATHIQHMMTWKMFHSKLAE